MAKHTLTGIIKRHRSFRSKIFGNRRDVLVYLPRGYSHFSRKRHPVLYLQDGQNVFDAATSFAGVEWGVDETAQRLIRQNLIEPLIIVAIANTGEDRIWALSDRRAQALHRQTISDETGSRVHRTGWIVARRTADAFVRLVVSECFYAVDRNVAIGLVGRPGDRENGERA